MAATYSKHILSGSTQGRPIKVVQTATAGTLIHTTEDDVLIEDEIWLWAYNDHTAGILLTIEFGGVTDPDDLMRFTVPNRSGWWRLIEGLPLKGDGATGLNIRAFAATANEIMIAGYVNRRTATA